MLVTLGERGVGAIYLGRAVTPFQLKDGQNATDGVVRSTGIYLDENYVTRTVQQLDLTV